MGRRWLVEVGETADETLYLSTEHYLPVTISYATRFKTKREATAAAKSRNIEPRQILRTWA